MLEPRNGKNGKPKAAYTRRGLSLPTTDNEKAVELAQRHYGGNVSLLISKLVQKAWEAETKASAA